MAGLKPNAIRVRMYRVGFGDCFLISLPVDSGHVHLLVDCGVHAKGDIGTIQSAVQNALGEAGNDLAVVVATHAHQDHISGFGTMAERFSSCRVREVWMPWTEDPKDPDAARLKAKQLAIIGKLRQHFAARPASAPALSALLNLAGNEKSLQVLKSGVNNGQVRYLDAGKSLNEPAGIKGLAVRVLGPPRDPAFLAKMDPPQGERFLRANGGRPEPLNGVRPFLRRWVFNPARAGQFPVLSEKDRKLLQDLAGDPEALAFTLDQAINNTSIVILLSYRGKHLLLAGDAQYGNWNYWLQQQGSEDLLASVDFYKVGHHGSFNATPRKALEKMTPKAFAAMAATQSAPWPSIPLDKLVAALQDRASGFMRSDSIPVKGAPKGPEVKKLPKGFSQGQIWLDYEILVA